MSAAADKLTFGTMARRAVKLRCPICGRGRPFKGWFGLRERCDACRFRFEREPGYFLGSIYLNYGLTGLVVLVWLVFAFTSGNVGTWFTVVAPVTFCTIFPLWFLRYSRALWMAFDLTFDAPTTKDFPDA